MTARARPVFFHLPELVADGKTCYLQHQGAKADLPTGNHAYTLYAEFKTTAARNMGIIGYGPLSTHPHSVLHSKSQQGDLRPLA